MGCLLLLRPQVQVQRPGWSLIYAFEFGLNKLWCLVELTVKPRKSPWATSLKTKHESSTNIFYSEVSCVFRVCNLLFFIKHVNAVHGQTVWSHLTTARDSSCIFNTTQWNSEMMCILMYFVDCPREWILFRNFVLLCWRRCLRRDFETLNIKMCHS